MGYYVEYLGPDILWRYTYHAPHVTCVSYKLIILDSKSPKSQYQIIPCHKVHIRFTAEGYSCIISLLLFRL